MWRLSPRAGKNSRRHIGVDGENIFWVGLTYPEDYFQKKLETIKNAGQRLHEINVRVRELERTWTGEETFVI